MMDAQLLLLTRRQLIHWGRWSQRLTTLGLDYSNQSLLARLQQQGGMIIRSSAKPTLPKNPEAEAMNHWVEQLAQDAPEGAAKPHWAEVLRIHYTMNDQPYGNRIQVSRLPKQTYYHYLSQAETWLAQHLLTNH